MNDIYCNCADPNCDPCIDPDFPGDLCCQDCDKNKTCKNRCHFVAYKEKIYDSTEFLINELDKLAEREDIWLIHVAVEKIKSLMTVMEKIESLLRQTKVEKIEKGVE